MDKELWRRAEQVFLTAVDMDEPSRELFLRSECGADERLLAQVRELLAGDAQASGSRENFALQVLSLLDPADGSAADSASNSVPEVESGTRLGAYRITRLIGEGGMGTVYHAERADGVFRQQTAIKLVRRGMNNSFVVERFLQERQILADLNHPYIARLLDGGTAPGGVPYFVMEYVEGEPLYRYCASRALGLRDRLRLFSRVCEAVAYAHGRRVVHRDLKPSNILVSNDGIPRLLDFGIAKILEPEGESTSIMMGTHMPLMTPEYASPEQLAGFGAGVRSDIYSLGIMLFELATGRSRRNADDPRWDGTLPVPSESIDSQFLPASGSPPSGVSPAELSSALRSGIDDIVRRATARRPTDRYQSSQELIDAIALYLEANPSTTTGPAPSARTPSRARLVWIAGAVAVCVGVGWFAAARSRFAAKASPERTVRLAAFTNLNGDEATARFARTLNDELVTELTEAGWKLMQQGGANVLEGSVRTEAGVRRVSARLLRPGAQSVEWARAFEGNRETDLARAIAGSLGRSRPEAPVNAEASATLVEGYTHLRWEGAPEESLKARERIWRAIATFEKATRESPQFARAWAGLAAAEAQMADHWDHPVYTDWMTKAETSARKALDLDPTLDDAYGTLGMALYFGRHDFKSALDAFARSAEFNPRSSTSHRLLADLFCLFNRYDEAVAELLRAQALNPADPDMVAHEALVRYWRRQFPEAETVARRAIAAKPDYWYGHWVLGMVLQQRKNFVEAEAELREARRLPSPGTRTVTALGHLLAETGRRAEAEEVLGAIKLRAQGSLRRYIYSEAMIRAGLGETDAAIALLEKSHEIADLSLPYTKLDPRMDSLRGPRYAALLKKLGLPE